MYHGSVLSVKTASEFSANQHLAQSQSTPSSQKVTPETRAGIEKLYTFQSTPSSQKVTQAAARQQKARDISIHTFLTEGDEGL